MDDAEGFIGTRRRGVLVTDENGTIGGYQF